MAEGDFRLEGVMGTKTDDLSWANLERALGLKFRSRDLLRQATIHKSYLNETLDLVESYERLEYLGDAFLSWVIAEQLFAIKPALDEGEMTRARASLVNGTSLAEIASALGLGMYLQLGRGEERSGGRTRTSILEAAFEAIVGAILSDRGPSVARKFVLRCFTGRLGAFQPLRVPRDPKSELQSYAQHTGMNLPEYRTEANRNEDESRAFVSEILLGGVMVGTGFGKRKIDAEQEAAQMALKGLPSHIKD